MPIARDLLIMACLFLLWRSWATTIHWLSGGAHFPGPAFSVIFCLISLFAVIAIIGIPLWCVVEYRLSRRRRRP